MKKYNRFLFVVILSFIILLASMEYCAGNMSSDREDSIYMVEINRLWQDILSDRRTVGELLDEADYVYNIEIIKEIASEKEKNDFYSAHGREYVVRKQEDTYYRFDYVSDNNKVSRFMNYVRIFVYGAVLLIMVTLLFVKHKIVKPFENIRNIPYELAKGNLTVPLKEEKNRYFGRFLWGLDMLRETLEDSKKRELELQKEKKTLILSISHDIKTPLSAIRLYAGALRKNLYKTKEKQEEAAVAIDEKVKQIEGYVSEIVNAASEDFLKLTVRDGEFYLKDLINQIRRYYDEKLEALHTEFAVGKYENCLVLGDLDRAVEVMQNIIENAIKYGDGRKIEIEIHHEERLRSITISNTGCRLKKEELPHIFDSFWRGSNVGNCNGSGLGLYICRQLMHMMHGEIMAECVEELGEKIMRVSIIFVSG